MNFNDLSAFWVSLVFTAIFLLVMAYRIFRSLFIDDVAIKGLILNLDNIRYTTMFLSFLLTQYFGILGGQKWLAGYELNAVQSALAYGVVLIAGIVVSMLISTMLIQSERALGEGNLTLGKLVAVWAIYIITAGIDFGTIYGGFIIVGEEVYQRTAKKVEVEMQHSDDAFEVNEYKKLYAAKKQEVEQKQQRIDALQNGGFAKSWSTDKKLKKIDAEIAWCNTKKRKHTTLDKKRKARVKELLAKTLPKLHEEKKKLEKEMNELLEKFSSFKTKRDDKKEEKLEMATKHKRTLEFLGIIFGLGLVIFNFVTSFIRGVLSDRRPAMTTETTESFLPKVVSGIVSQQVEEEPQAVQKFAQENTPERDTDTEIFSYLASRAQRDKPLPGYRDIVEALGVRNDDISNFYKNFPHYYVQEGRKRYPSDAMLDAIEQSA